MPSLEGLIENIDVDKVKLWSGTGSSLICQEGVQVFHGVGHEGALLPTLLCSLQHYYPNITIIWDDRICMFAVLLRFTLSFVYKVCIGFYHVCVTGQLL
jgi:hypothetical protein